MAKKTKKNTYLSRREGEWIKYSMAVKKHLSGRKEWGEEDIYIYIYIIA